MIESIFNSIKPVIFKIFITLVLLIFLTNLGISQTPDTSGVHHLLNVSFDDLLNTEIVTATKKSQIANEAPAGVYLITSEIIKQRGYRNLTEVLEDVPGIDFSMKQPSGEYPSHLSFRGISDVGQTNVLFMVDGVLQNDISNGWVRGMGFEFPLIDILRIEIIYGPGSALYGANAYAGIINIITDNGDDLTKFNNHRSVVGISYGSYQTISPELSLAYRFKSGLKMMIAGQWHVGQGDGGVNRSDPGNYYHNNYEPDSVLTTEYGWIVNERNPDGSRKKLEDGFKNNIKDFGFRLKLVKDGFTLGANAWQRDEGLSSQIVGYKYFTNTENIDYCVKNSGHTIYTSYQFSLSDKITSKTLAYFYNTNVLPATGFLYTYKYQSVNNGIDPPVENKKKGYNGSGYMFRIEQQLDIETGKNNNLTLGFLYENAIRQYFGISLGPEQDASSTIVSSTYTNQEPSVQPVFYSTDIAVYAQDELRLFKNYVLTTGLRFDHSTNYGSILNPRIAFVGKPGNKFAFKALYGTAFKAPTIFQLYDEWRGNVDLTPQTIQTVEAEVNYNIKNLLSVSLNLYYSMLSNLIIIAENPDTTLVPIGPYGEHADYYQNIGKSGIYGFSMNTNIKATENIIFSANYMFTLNEDGNEIPHIAKHKLNVVANMLFFKKLNVNLRANYTSKVNAPQSNLYFYPKTSSSIAQVGYDYVTENNPDGYVDPVVLFNLTLSGSNIYSNKYFELTPQLIVRNILNTQYFTLGRQSGSGTRPVDEIQPTILEPKGFIPAYHPQAGREIFLRILFSF